MLLHTQVSPSQQAPILLGASFAAYLLILLVVGIIQFRDCPEDAEALKKVGFAAIDLIAHTLCLQ